ncbi:pyridoxamine 5'-phosphate oxidase family protein [Jannaschia marina]|uniref:pyridoxamine 5'-phosphate oxidase family protein n=1 Tax=Jannaschia marina TaxID=2741674 RepID=UPI0015C7C530|nr:pyridoxamine 5'-phosphate oxidase family protein [Jannaschia marina]
MPDAPHRITDLETLAALYPRPAEMAHTKVANRITPLYGEWIETSRFCIVATAGPEGTDASPRGDDGPVVQIADETTLLLPDWRGNNRLDTLRNIVTDGRIALMFMAPPSKNVVRVNGTATLSTDPALVARFEGRGRPPTLVAVIEVAEVYVHCGRAILRAGLWDRESGPVPSVGELVAEQTAGDFDGAGYDAAWADRAKGTLW